MSNFFELHRHSEFSIFDGFGKIKSSVKRAKELGYTALGISDHGTMSGLVEHYKECKVNDINPICGIEGYFQPSFNPDKPSYHICLFAKDLKGYQNLCRMITEANIHNFYRTAKITWELLEKYHEGLICTSACIAGVISQLVVREQTDKAEKTINRFKTIFGDDYYIEIMPYKIDEVGTQERIDRELIKLANKTKTKVIITTDSHFVKKEDFSTHKKMFEMQKKDMGDTYKERYMPSEKQIIKRCEKLYGNKYNPQTFFNNLQEINDKCNLVLEFEGTIPQLEWDNEPEEQLKIFVKRGLKEKGKFTSEYKAQVKHELDTIKHLGFEDYFLLVYDFMQAMKKMKIPVMPGRGSVCGSIVAYSLGITDVDPLIMGTNFDRFLRKDKKKLADIDLDLASNRREEAIQYLDETYAGQITQICTFGYYRTANLSNDLGKVYGLTEEEIEEMKTQLENIVSDRHRTEILDLDELLDNQVIRNFEETYPLIITHFSKLWGQIKFFGTHASGIAITSSAITNYMPLVRSKDGLRSCFDMESVDNLHILKLDVLGLINASVIGDIEEMVGESFKYEYLEDDEVYKEFRDGNTAGIFQFESYGGTKVIKQIQPDNFFDIVAANALNRPAPKQLGMVEQYVRAKNGEVDTSSSYYQYAKDSHGCLIYQETVLRICREFAKMEWDDVDRQIKLAGKETKEKKELREKFVSSLVEQKLMTRQDAEALHELMSLYLFNKGHAVGYALIGFYEMYLKHYYPFEFYLATLKHTVKELEFLKYKVEAVRKGIILIPPNVNGSANYEMVLLDGNKVIQEGLSCVKGIGIKTALEIEKNAPYKNYKEFESKLPKKIVNKKAKEALIEADCFIFDEDEVVNRIAKYNNSLMRRKVR